MGQRSARNREGGFSNPPFSHGQECHAEQVVEGHAGRSVAQQRRIIRRRQKLLRVVFEDIQDKYVVITAYLTSDIKRYWKDKAL